MELPSKSATLELASHYGRLRARLRSELTAPRLVLPTNDYFPDRFDGSQATATRLVHRMQMHAHIEDIPVRVSVEDLASPASTSCSSGACGSVMSAGKSRLELTADGWALLLTQAELAHPVALTASVARALGLVFLEETRLDGSPLPQPLELYAELSAVLLGFGVLLTEASHVYAKACSGPRVTQLTLLSTPELALLTALFAAEHRFNLKPALKASSLTQRTLLSQAHDLVRANPRLLEWIVQANTSDPKPNFELVDGKPSVVAAVFEKLSALRAKPVEPDFDTWLRTADTESQPPRLPRLAGQKTINKPDPELKALVAEVLDADVSVP